MSPRLKPRFTPVQGARIESLAAELGLRPAQVVQRLAARRLSRVPLANRQLYQELARSAANLTQLQEHLEQSPTSHPALSALAAAVAEELGTLRLALLGVRRVDDLADAGEGPAGRGEGDPCHLSVEAEP